MVDEPRITGDIGGQPKITYWTPDGRVIRSMPDMHEYSRTNGGGKVVESGIRDANLDRGWLLQKPNELKLYCLHCDQWHDTQKEITECGRKKKTFVAKSVREAKKNGDDRISSLENDMTEIKSLLKQLIGSK